ncbi:MAG: M20/M25/M40 family metallo-hydrolase [Bacteroidia bacterium]|nr:M20/M25/M40 family metallo-hydrolase [Bacteroidia bacterium]
MSIRNIRLGLLAIGMMIPFVSGWTQINRDARKTAMIRHVETLADDVMEGREAGSPGEKMAADYIIANFKKAGLKPVMADGSYLQPFDFLAGREYVSLGTRFEIGEKKMKSYEFYPLPWSGNGKVEGKILYVRYGITAPELKYNDYASFPDDSLKGKILMMEAASPDGKLVHSEYDEYLPLYKRVRYAQGKGAAAVIFVNHDPQFKEPTQLYKKGVSPVDIPVIFLRDIMEQYPVKVCNKLDGTKALVYTQMVDVRTNAHNVIGFLDNAAENTVVIGAHYDHLGWGDEGSLHRGEKAIHNGADDNASGVAMLIELAKSLADPNAPRKNNYLFIAFSGEEKGLLGSNYYVKNPVSYLSAIDYMLNFDMVGRLDKEEPSLGINGVGTSPVWENLLENVHKSTSRDDFKVKTTASGVGPSDHTSFYLKDIPVLHFFTGTHEDYHKPTDDVQYINYEGMLEIHDFVMDLIARLDNQPKIDFTKTADKDDQEVPRFTVTLGVVPDYMFEGKGMRIDGVTDEKPAAVAGLKAGDVVTQLGEHKVTDMMSYMEALSKFKKGDSTTVYILRGERAMQREIQF